MITHFTKHWFRVLGWGLVWNHKNSPMLFSERIGKRKHLKIGNYRIRILKPNGI